MKLELDLAALKNVREAMIEALSDGLEKDDQQIPAIPAFLPPPGNVVGEAIVLDVGGTNMRAALVGLFEDGPRILAGPIKAKLPVRDPNVQLNAERFFSMQAELIMQLKPPPGLPLGYCFSYPSKVFPSRDASLLRWTKGLAIEGVVGERVGAALLQALKRVGYQAASIAVLNDTVASMLGGTAVVDPALVERTIGLIAGTGSNMSAFFSPAKSPKLAALSDRPMAVNLESGNFHPPHLTDWDDQVDAGSNNRGAQRYEKAISGHYLPQIFACALPEAAALKSSADLVWLRDHSQEHPEEAKLAAALLKRSARLCATGLASVAHFFDGDRSAVVAEGSLFWGDPLYADEVSATLARLDPKSSVQILKLEHANLIGSAIASRTPL